MYDDYILRKEVWEDYQDHLADMEQDIVIDTVNKLYNNKGYMPADYGVNSDFY